MENINFLVVCGYIRINTTAQIVINGWYNSALHCIAFDSDIGKGFSNTAAIILVCGAGDYAAKLCDDLVTGSFNDWFLPSRDELDQMYLNLHQQAVGEFTGTRYWSSTDTPADGTMALYYDFSNGSSDTNLKSELYRVRAA